MIQQDNTDPVSALIYKVMSGVPQVSDLGPLFFFCFVYFFFFFTIVKDRWMYQAEQIIRHRMNKAEAWT